MTLLNTLLEQQGLAEAVAATNDTLLETADMLEEALGESTVEQPSSNTSVDELQFFSQDHIPGLSDEDLSTKFSPDNTAPLNFDNAQMPSALKSSVPSMRLTLEETVQDLLSETRMSDDTEGDSYPIDVDNKDDINGNDRSADFGAGAETRHMNEGTDAECDDSVDDMEGDSDELEYAGSDEFESSGDDELEDDFDDL